MNQETAGFHSGTGRQAGTPRYARVCRTERNAVYFDAVISFRGAKRLESFELWSTEYGASYCDNDGGGGSNRRALSRLVLSH